MATSLDTTLAKLSFSSKQRLRVYRKIAVMTRYGLPLNRVLDMIHDQATHNGRKPSAPMAVVMDSWRRAIRNGRSLSQAAGPWVPFNERMMIEAGEESQNLSTSLENLIAINLGSSKMKGAIIGGLAYPVILALSICAVLWLFGLKVIPAFDTIHPKESWTGLAGQMAAMSDAVQVYLLPSIIGIVLFIALLVWLMPRWTGPLRKHADKIPPFSIYRLVTGAGFMMSIGALIAAGVQTSRALEKIARNASPWLKERLNASLRYVYSGQNMGRSLQKAGHDFPDKEIIEDLVAYADLPAFTEMLEQIGQEWLENAIEMIKGQAKIINGVMLVLMGATISWMFSGLFDIQQQISNATQGGGF